MKLSEAMMLGDGLRKREPRLFLAQEGDHELCGCALGGAALAVGSSCEQKQQAGGAIAWLKGLWPWLDHPKIDDISSRFSDVFYGLDSLTFEQLVDYVRSIEPACGECNCFECVCEKQRAEQPVSMAVAQ